MTRVTRRELLAWVAAGSATAATGWSLTRGGSDASPGGGGPLRDRTGTPSSTTEGAADESSSADVGGILADAGGGMAAKPPQPGERLLVVVELPGGNDGLSTVVPYGIGAYYDARSDLAIAAADVHRLDDVFGLHPNLAGIAQRGVAVVHGVGVESPDGSHFEMMQRWWSGETGPRDSTSLPTGWVGRLADVLDDDGALAAGVTLGSGAHPIVRSRGAATLAIPDASSAWYLAGADNPVAAAFQRGVATLGSSAGWGDSFGGRITATTSDTAALAGRLVEVDAERPSYPDTQIGRSLAFAHTLFTLGAGVRVVHVAMDGEFDTHEGHGWKHPELMKSLDEAVTAFWNDLDANGMSDRVLMVTTSEFGRTVRQNGSAGLDHGTASSMLVMGGGVSGMIGEQPSLTKLDDNGDQIASMGFDSYLGSVVEGWLGVPASEVFPNDPEVIDLGLA